MHLGKTQKPKIEVVRVLGGLWVIHNEEGRT
jgi:hypothetical protein